MTSLRHLAKIEKDCKKNTHTITFTDYVKNVNFFWLPWQKGHGHPWPEPTETSDSGRWYIYFIPMRRGAVQRHFGLFCTSGLLIRVPIPLSVRLDVYKL